MIRQCLNIELYKLYRRKGTWIVFLLLLFLPIFFAYFTGTEASFIDVGDSVFSGLVYAMGMLGFSKMLLIFYVLIIIYTCSLFASEIDTGILAMFSAKAGKRQPLLFARIIVLTLFIIVLHAAVFCSASLGWFLFLRGTAHGTLLFADLNTSLNQITVFTYIFSCMECLLLILISVISSLFLSFQHALITGFAYIVTLKIFEYVKPLRNFIPTYIGAGSVFTQLSEGGILYQAIASLGLLLFYLALMLGIAIYRYKHMDFVR